VNDCWSRYKLTNRRRDNDLFASCSFSLAAML
jgi:hypothetical protein